MKNKLRRRLTALALCGVMIFSGSASALADSPTGEIDETLVVQEQMEQVIEEVVEEANTEVQEQNVEELTPEVTEPVVEEAPEAETPVEEVTEEAETETPAEEVKEETPVVEEVVEEVVAEEVEAPAETVVEEVEEIPTEPVVEEQPTIVEKVAEAVSEATEKIVEVVETVIRYIIGMHDDLTYEDDQVVIKVYAEQDEIIPEGTKIKVVPILADDEETKEKYEEVAAQLQEKAAEEEQVVEGFLAYDITLVDPDGNEFEPYGEVKVTMEYKEAALPAEVENVEEAEVTIHHFEEDANGEVKEIVDMVAEAAIEAVVEVTEAAEVEKVEFVTESFSTYTVTWTRGNYSTRVVFHYGYLSENEFVEFDGGYSNGSISTNNNTTTRNIESTFGRDIDGYLYSHAYVNSGSRKVTVTTLRNSNGTIQYQSGNSWSNLSGDVYLVYTKPATITTVDSKSNHVNISLTDYSIWTQSQRSWSHDVLYSVNDGHSLKFVTTGNQLSSPNYNVYTGGSSPRQGFVNNNLYSNYPRLKSAEESLAYLFNSPETYDANYLFKKVGDYYVYDSAANFAEFNTTTKEFTVYEQSNVGFFPFNKFTDDVQANQTSQSASTNHHFGMHVDFTFMQPKNGLDNGNPMIFEFKGDDDVWVFIDGMLVLDLGGIHQSTGGTINFATGVVDYTNATDTTIRQMYINALVEQGLNQTAATQQANTDFVQYTENGNTYYRFKDYSQHKLDFFYLERGAHDTNCMIKYNLISIPENSIFVEKEITKSNMADFADAEFTFKIETKAVQEDGSYPEQSTILANTSYKLYELDSNDERVLIGERTTDANGQFVLKHRQVAEFSNILASTKYCITEIGVTSEVYDEVVVDGADVEIKHSKEEHGLTKHDYTTGDVLAQDLVYVEFANQCNVSNFRNLIIEKKMAGNQTSTETFKIKVEFKADENWIPFIGTYFLDSSTGTPVTTENGIIELTAGQTAYILGLISGTEYRVTEQLSEGQQENFAAPAYSGTGTATENGISSVIEIGDVTNEGAKIDYVATVTNTLLTKTVNVNKVWLDTDAAHNPIYVGLYKKVDGQWQATGSYVELKDGALTATFEGLDYAAEYDVKELVQAAEGEFTINGSKYTATGVYYTVGDNDYKVTYSDPAIDGYTTNITITNTLLSKIEVEKVWNDGNTDHTNDIVYVGLYKVSGEQKELVDKKTLTATSWKTVFDKLETSTEYTYEVKELIPGENDSYTAIDENGIYSNGIFEYKVSYTKEGNSKVVITNTIKDKVVVEKIWMDADDANEKRPETLDIYLKDGEDVVTLTLGKDKSGAVETVVLNGKTVRAEFTTDWCATLYGVSSEYTFEEEAVQGYVSNKSVDADKVTFINTFSILIIKESATGKNPLEGAIFKITQGNATYYAESSMKGYLDNWFASFEENQLSQPVDKIPDGTYVLSEVIAPVGYMLSDKEWNIQIANGLIVKVEGTDVPLVEKLDGKLQFEAYVMSFANTALYELPSTGGLGIYVPMMSGVIMMMAAALILMKNKRKEVLER